MIWDFKPYEGNLPYIFVSYSHMDAYRVAPILNRLSREGYRIWFDEGIEWGSEWPEEIAGHLKKCAVFLPFHSPVSAKSENCKQEIYYAVSKFHKPTLSIYLEKTILNDGTDFQLSYYQQTYFYNYNNVEDFYARLLESKILKSCKSDNGAIYNSAAQNAEKAFHNSGISSRVKMLRGIISAGASHTAILKKDGTVMAVGNNHAGQCNVSDWKNIVYVAARNSKTIGLKSDGTVVAAGWDKEGQCDVSGWKDIVAISAGMYHTVGLRANGTVVSVGRFKVDLTTSYPFDFSGWKNIKKIYAKGSSTIALTSDGTVIANDFRPPETLGGDWSTNSVFYWKDIVDVSLSAGYYIGLKSDGTVILYDIRRKTIRDDITAPKDLTAVSGSIDVFGLRANGTVIRVAADKKYGGKIDVSGWKDIAAISVGPKHIVGLKSDGTVVAEGENNHGQCNVTGCKI